jgi:hypothetical protein
MIYNYIQCYNNIRKSLLDYFGDDISYNKIDLKLLTDVDTYNDNKEKIIQVCENIENNEKINKYFKKVISEVYLIIRNIKSIQDDKLNTDYNFDIIHKIYYSIINTLIESKQIPDYVKEAVNFFYSNNEIRREKLGEQTLEEIKDKGKIIANFFEIQNKEE